MRFKLLALALILLGWSAPATAAVAVATAVTLFASAVATTDAAIPGTNTITPGAGANRVLVVTVNISMSACAATPETVSTVTDDQGQAYVRFAQFKLSEGVGSCSGADSRGVHEVWRTINPANVATTVTVTPTGGQTFFITFGGVVYTGADQTTPLTNATSLYQASGSATITRSVSSAAGDMVSDILCNGSAVPTVANGQTARWDGGADGNTNCASAVTGTAPGASSFDDTWNVDAGDSSAITAFNVAAVAAAGNKAGPLTEGPILKGLVGPGGLAR